MRAGIAVTPTTGLYANAERVRYWGRRR